MLGTPDRWHLFRARRATITCRIPGRTTRCSASRATIPSTASAARTCSTAATGTTSCSTSVTATIRCWAGLATTSSLPRGPGADLLDGGEGDDFVESSVPGTTLLGGIGQDTLLGSWGVILTGGAGSDAFYVGRQTDATSIPQPLVVTDFQVGPGGDRIYIDSLMGVNGIIGWGVGGASPFAYGYLRLRPGRRGHVHRPRPRSRPSGRMPSWRRSACRASPRRR